MLNQKIAQAKNIPEALDTAAELFGKKEALRYKTKPGDIYSGVYSFIDLPRVSRIVGTVLIEKYGLQPEQRVAFISENRPEYNFGDWGTLFAGGVAWGLYDYDVKTDEIVEYKLKDSETEILITSPAFLENVRRVHRGGNTPLKQIIVMDMPHDDIKYQPHETPFSDIMKNGAENAALIGERLKAVTRDSVAHIIYTSGTTGMPKGVMLSHHNLLSNVECSSKMMTIDSDERLISFLPEAHSFQGFVTLAALFNGASIWYSHKSTLLDDLKLVEPTLFAGVPMVYKRFAEGMRSKALALTKDFIDLGADYSKNPLKNHIRKKLLGQLILKKIGMHKLRRAVSGSAKLDVEHARILENIGFIVLEGYGISETSPVISVERFVKRKSGSVGFPLPGVDVKILSLEEDETGKRRTLPACERGEIICKGPNVFKGYLKDETKTRRAIVDGYYHTGDIGHIDEDGFLFVHGRCGLQVKMSNGEFVDLDELAANILRCTKYVQAAAVDAEGRESAVAVVSLAWEPEALEEIGKELGIPYRGDPSEFARNEKIIEAIKNELEENAGMIGNPRSITTPRKFLIVAPMSPETGDITSTLKFRVRQILEKYRPQIEELRKSDEKYLIYIK
ncbi:MAG: AMP-binding protein [bacterium]